jgi:hypothetical protein
LQVVLENKRLRKRTNWSFQMKQLKYVLLLLSLSCYGQKYDYNWIIGLYGSVPSFAQNPLFGPSQLQFTSDTVSYYRHLRPLDMSYSSLAASDSNGQLIFYTNLLQINDTLDDTLVNGLGLNPGLHAQIDSEINLSYGILKGAFVLPDPGSDSLFYLLHIALSYTDSLPQGGVDSFFYYTLIDMKANNGLGAVRRKNVIMAADYLMGEGGLSACRHANGRDWWIFVPKLFSNCYYQYLLSPKGFDSLGLQCAGDSFATNTDRGGSCFSPDGSKFIWVTPYDSLHIMDFDRCTGLLSSSGQPIPIYDSLALANNTVYIMGVAVSPNSQYLYVGSGTELWQFNLLANNIAESRVLIDNLAQGLVLSSTETLQLGPDGKIYINPIGQDTFFHVINLPDSPGVACKFEKNGISTPTYHWECMPLYPNYRLGPLTGSACDTIGKIDTPSITRTIKAKENVLKIFPNPSSDYTVIDYGFTDWSKGPVVLEIDNAMGQAISSIQLPMYSGFQKIDISWWASGIYTAFVKRNNSIIAAAKFVKG